MNLKTKTNTHYYSDLLRWQLRFKYVYLKKKTIEYTAQRCVLPVSFPVDLLQKRNSVCTGLVSFIAFQWPMYKTWFHLLWLHVFNFSISIQVKQRLDYQMELGNVMRRVEQRHMVDWIISNVRKSITAKQEDEALKKCVADLKALAK